MIIEISVENFLSIKDKITLSMDASSSKKLEDNILALNKKERLLKSAVMYGANASGKSNIIKAVFFIWTMVKTSNTYNVDTMLSRVPFKLDEQTISKPSKFEIIFITNGIKYKYGFSCTEEGITEEYLYSWANPTEKKPRGKESLIFKRNELAESIEEKYQFNTDKPQQEAIRSQMINKVLYLSRATALGYEKTKPVYEYIINIGIFGEVPFSMDIAKRLLDDEKFRSRLLEILQGADFGGIIDIIAVKEETKKIRGVEIKFNEKDIAVNQTEPKEYYDFRFVHKNAQGKSIQFTLSEESAGTFRTIAILSFLFDVLEKGRVLFVDELEKSLHPAIVEFIVKMFNNKNNSNAQIIFTTHNTNLLKNDIFRRDQIYICSKKPNKNTELSAYIDYKIRESSDFEKIYLNGRVGGVPIVDESVLK